MRVADVPVFILQSADKRHALPRTASSVVTKFLAADRAAAASVGFILKFLASVNNAGTVFVEPRKNLSIKIIW